MTTLLYAKDYIKTKINSEEINLYVDNIDFLTFLVWRGQSNYWWRDFIRINDRVSLSKIQEIWGVEIRSKIKASIKKC